MARELDPAWKEALDNLLPEFFAHFSPAIHDMVDWSVPPENLETELPKIIREAEVGKVIADRLYRVRRRDGTGDLWLYIHMEFQNQRDERLPERMFTYHYRIRDARGQAPVGIAILGDTSPDWRPTRYQWQVANTRLTYEFETLKVWDWRDRIAELEAMSNPFALVMLAHLQSHLTDGRPDDRYDWKWRLIRLLAAKGYEDTEYRQILNIIDWFLELPENLERRIASDLTVLNREKIMPLPMSRYERATLERGREEGRLQGRQEALRLVTLILTKTFGDAGRLFAETHLANADASVLEKVTAAALDGTTLEDLQLIVAGAS